MKTIICGYGIFRLRSESADISNALEWEMNCSKRSALTEYVSHLSWQIAGRNRDCLGKVTHPALRLFAR